jgi:DNA relaxase NicK
MLLFKTIEDMGMEWKASRIDVALDTQIFTTYEVIDLFRGDGTIPPQERLNAAKLADLVVTDAMKLDVFEGYSDAGATAYVGSRSSDKFLRIYHKMDGYSFGDGVPHTRCEMQFRHDYSALVARGLFDAMNEGGIQAVIDYMWGLLNGFIRFKTLWWEKFVQSAHYVAVVMKATVSTIGSATAYLMNQMSTTLFMVCAALSKNNPLEGRRFIDEMLAAGKQTMTTKHWAKVLAFAPHAETVYAYGAVQHVL